MVRDGVEPGVVCGAVIIIVRGVEPGSSGRGEGVGPGVAFRVIVRGRGGEGEKGVLVFTEVMCG